MTSATTHSTGVVGWSGGLDDVASSVLPLTSTPTESECALDTSTVHMQWSGTMDSQQSMTILVTLSVHVDIHRAGHVEVSSCPSHGG